MIRPMVFKKVQALALENSPVILSGIGVIGTVTTAVLTGRASFKAADIIRKEREDPDLPELSTKEKVFLVGTEFIPPVGVGVITITSIIYANKISSSRAAAMAAAYAVSDKTFSEYKEKVAERLGVAKETEIRDEIAQERIHRTPAQTVIITGEGDVLCFDTFSGRYFRSTVDRIKKAENEINAEILTCDGASLSRFYDEIGLEPTAHSDSVGWNMDNRCDVQISAVMTKEDKPCLSVDFAGWPKPDYGRIWQ